MVNFDVFDDFLFDDVLDFTKSLDKLFVITRGEKGAVLVFENKITENGIENNLNMIKKIDGDSTCHFEIWEK